MNNNYSTFFGGANGVPPQGEKNSEFYSPKPKDGKGGVYNAIIRFVPYFKDPSKSTITKWQSYVKNPISKVGRTLDNYSDFNNPSQITNMFFRFKNTNVATFVDYAKEHLSSNQYHFSLVQVIQDEQHPELVNKILVFRYSKTIYDKLAAELSPTIPGQYGINPFDPIHGRFFHIVVKEKGGFANYDDCSFFDLNNNGTIIPPGVRYIDAAGNLNVATDQMNDAQRQALFEYVSQNSPDLSKYNYREWTAEDREFVNTVLQISENYANTGQLVDTRTATLQNSYAALANPGQPTAQPAAPAAPMFPGATLPPQPVNIPQPAAPQFNPVAPAAAPTAPQPAAPVSNGMNFFSSPTAPQPTAPVVTPQTPAQAPTAPTVGMNVDDVLSQL